MTVAQVMRSKTSTRYFSENYPTGENKWKRQKCTNSKTKDAKTSSTGRVTVDNARVDRLKEQHISTPQEIDNERVRIMAEVYEGTAGYQQIIRRAKFFATLIERKKLYIDENLFVGSMASTVNGSTRIRNGTWSG